MSAIHEVITALIVGGMDPAVAATLVATAIVEGASKKRSTGAERTARYRERKSSQSVTCDGDEMGSVLPFEPSQTVTKRHNVTNAISILKENKKERSPKGASLPDDWKPDSRDYSYAAKLGLTVQETDGMGEDLRLWARANSNRAVGRKADWRSTFHGWMRREAPKIIRQRKGGGDGGFRWNGGIEGVI